MITSSHRHPSRHRAHLHATHRHFRLPDDRRQRLADAILLVALLAVVLGAGWAWSVIATG